MLDDPTAAALERLCDLLVPGSSRVVAGSSAAAAAHTEVKSAWVSMT